MKIIYKNFEIEEDRNSFILTKYWTVPLYDRNWKQNKTAWERVIIEQVYPSSLKRCLEKILHSIKRDNESKLELKDAIKEIERINNKAIEEINILINNK